MNASTASIPVDITILVKALNEEAHIEACLRSTQRALAGMPGLTGEILLADSVSTDRTIEIAMNVGVRIVQFENAADRSCGATLQLGYQYALGRYIYVIDGDMELIPEFLPRAFAYLQDNPDVAGVAGKLIDTAIRTAADRKRTEYYASLRAEQEVPSLGGGGLYRRDIVDQVGYLANRWLPAFEEAELGVRLRAAGYRLVRLGDPAVMHSGHAETTTQMLRRLWRNGRIKASGMFLRSALGHPWFGATAKTCWFVLVAPALYALALVLMMASGLAGLPWPVFVTIPFVIWMSVLLVLGIRKRSAGAALLTVFSWHVYGLGAILGFLHPPADPLQPISARELGDRVQV